MAISLLDQETQISQTAPVANYSDAVVPTEADFETNPTSLEDDLNNIRSQLHNFLDGQGSNWFGDLVAPATLEAGVQRGINDLNDGLHAVEKKRALAKNFVHIDVVVTAAQNWEVLLIGELPTNTTAAVGAVTTLGTVAAAHGGTFGTTHSLAEVAGVPDVSPKNLCDIVDSVTHDPITSAGRTVYALFQTENAADGHTMTGTTPNRAQLSFVRLNAGGTALEACPVVDIAGQTIHYQCRERKRWEDFTEQDFLNNVIVDVPTGVTVTRQAGYDSQGVTPVDVTTNSFLDLEGPGLTWSIRDDLEAALFRITEGSAGGTSEILFGLDVDTFNNDAVVNDFLNGTSFDTGSAATTINVGVTANQIDSGGTLTVRSAAASDMTLLGGGELYLDDGNRTGSTWALAGMKLSETQQEWSDLETVYGAEKSLIAMLIDAKASTTRRIVYAAVTAPVALDTNVSGPTTDNNLDTDLGDLSGHDFGLASTKLDIYLNGAVQVQDSSAAGANDKDVYPGTSLALGQLKFEKKLKIGNIIYIVDWLEVP